tara:strand:- start:20477 stop:21679 length:1203 start_codon:yes stop_codon:yes gene_type:complete
MKLQDPKIGYPYFLQPNLGYRSTIESDYISSKVLQSAIAGDAQALNAVREQFADVKQSMVVDGENVEYINFSWRETSGSIVSSRQLRFGGLLWASGHRVDLKDVRDEHSVGINRYSTRWDDSGWSFNPLVSKTVITRDGAVSDWLYVNPVSVFGLLSVCLVCTWLVAMGGQRLVGVHLRKGYILMGLLIAALLYSMSQPRDSKFDSMIMFTAIDNRVGGTYWYEELDQSVSDDAKLIELCRKLLEALPYSQSDEMILRRDTLYMRSFFQHWAEPQSAYFSLAISDRWPLVGYQRISYPEHKPEEKIPDRHRRSVWNDFAEQGILTLQWGPIEDQRTASLGVFTLASIGVLFTLIWKFTHWVARFALGRVQKRRVRRSACIYCAYPLTQAGVQARYPENIT